MFTVLALCAGLTSIRYALDGRFELAMALIIVAVVSLVRTLRASVVATVPLRPEQRVALPRAGDVTLDLPDPTRLIEATEGVTASFIRELVRRAVLRTLDRDPEVDVVVLARGGGSVEDLLPFSDEALVRAVHRMRTPVVSAIGHEPDQPLLGSWVTWRRRTRLAFERFLVPGPPPYTAMIDWRPVGTRSRHAALDREPGPASSASGGINARPSVSKPGPAPAQSS